MKCEACVFFCLEKPLLIYTSVDWSRKKKEIHSLLKIINEVSHSSVKCDISFSNVHACNPIESVKFRLHAVCINQKHCIRCVMLTSMYGLKL